MPGKPSGKPHNTYREGGKPKSGATSEPLPRPARNSSRDPRHAGQGSEGFSKGYGGSGGSGETGPSGPEKPDGKS